MSQKILEIPYSGLSMYPCLQEGDSLIVEWFDEPRAPSEFQNGQLVIHKDHSELMVHRIFAGKIRSDWSGQSWNNVIMGAVKEIKTQGRALNAKSWSTPIYSHMSRFTDSSLKPLRWGAKATMVFVSRIERG